MVLNWPGLHLTILYLLIDVQPDFQKFFVSIQQRRPYKSKINLKKHTEDDLCVGYSVHLHYQPATEECSPERSINELKRAWPTINSLWLLESNLACVKNRKPNPHIV